MKVEIMSEEAIEKRVAKEYMLQVTLADKSTLSILVSMWTVMSTYPGGMDESDWEFIDGYDLDKYEELDDEIKDEVSDFISSLLCEL